MRAVRRGRLPTGRDPIPGGVTLSARMEEAGAVCGAKEERKQYYMHGTGSFDVLI